MDTHGKGHQVGMGHTLTRTSWNQRVFFNAKGQRNKETTNKNEPKPTFAPLTLCVMNFMPVLAKIS
jgi:hypothetical protein